jgi:RNA polymerase sigma factor (TIGR02999 family)
VDSAHDPTGEVTVLLQAWAGGDRSVEDRLFSLVLPDLHRLAQHLMRRERADHSLQPTILINEVYMRLVRAKDRDWENRRHFFAVAARAMRHLLIDYARARPSGAKLPVEELEQLLRGRDEQIELGVVIHELLTEMETAHPDWCAVVDLKFFAGFTDEEAATALNLPLRTMQRQFADARRWLFQKLEHRRCKATPNATNS